MINWNRSTDIWLQLSEWLPLEENCSSLFLLHGANTKTSSKSLPSTAVKSKVFLHLRSLVVEISSTGLASSLDLLTLCVQGAFTEKGWLQWLKIYWVYYCTSQNLIAFVDCFLRINMSCNTAVVNTELLSSDQSQCVILIRWCPAGVHWISKWKLWALTPDQLYFQSISKGHNQNVSLIQLVPTLMYRWEVERQLIVKKNQMHRKFLR